MNKERYKLVALLVATLVGIEYLGGSHLHPGFFAWFGFASCVILVIVALLLGKVIKRKDSYYHD